MIARQAAYFSPRPGSPLSVNMERYGRDGGSPGPVQEASSDSGGAGRSKLDWKRR